MFRIAAFAQLTGASPKVLRDYDRAGVFRPAWVDSSTGYRMYSPAQLPELRRILALRDLGVSLAEIRALRVEAADLREVLERRRAALEHARRDAERRLARLGISLAAPDGVNGPDVVLRELQSELVATLDTAKAGGDIGKAFYELELAIRHAGVRVARPPGALLWGSTGDLGEPAAEVFVPIRRAANGLSVSRLPPVRAATILHHGTYETLGTTRLELDRWIEAAGLQPQLPVRILYVQFGAEEDLRLPVQYLVDRASALVTEIQVPVAVDAASTALPT